MKIAISTKGNDLDADIDPRFGRAQNFIIYDTATSQFEVLENKQNVEAAQGAGIQAAMNIAGKNVEYLITGHCGPNAFRTLNASGIKVITGASGVVKDALERFKKGELKTADAPDVQGHWM